MLDLEGLPAIHFTEMAEVPPDSPIYAESKTFRREWQPLLRMKVHSHIAA